MSNRAKGAELTALSRFCFRQVWRRVSSRTSPVAVSCVRGKPLFRNYTIIDIAPRLIQREPDHRRHTASSQIDSPMPDRRLTSVTPFGPNPTTVTCAPSFGERGRIRAINSTTP